MSKLININDYLTLANYAKKYGVCKRKVYRYRNEDEIDYINIDGIFFIKDERSSILETNHSGTPTLKNVKILTNKDINVKILTSNDQKPLLLTENEDYKNVKILTSDNRDVKILTSHSRLDELLAIPENKRTIKDFEEINELRKNF